MRAHALGKQKDERLWVVTALISIFHARPRLPVLAALLRRCLGEVPPVDGLTSWDQALAPEDELRLFFEVSLPTPPDYRRDLAQHLHERVAATAHPCPVSANRPSGHDRRSTRPAGWHVLPARQRLPGELAATIHDVTASVIASQTPTRTAAAQPAGRATPSMPSSPASGFSGEIWTGVPEHARSVGFSRSGGRPPTAAESAGPTHRPAARHNRRICAQTTGQSMQSAQANIRQGECG
jgi:hypothetical protein